MDTPCLSRPLGLGGIDRSILTTDTDTLTDTSQTWHSHYHWFCFCFIFKVQGQTSNINCDTYNTIVRRILFCNKLQDCGKVGKLL